MNTPTSFSPQPQYSPATVTQPPTLSSYSLSPRYFQELDTQFCEAVCGSNKIENAGVGERITTKLCKQVLDDEPIQASLTQADSEYHEIEAWLRAGNQAIDSMAVNTRRLETIQHAEAFNFLIDKVVPDGLDLTLPLVLEAHKILCKDILHDGDFIGGQLRKHEIAARYGKQKQATPFIRASSLPMYMSKLFQDLNDEIVSARGALRIDPYDLATKYAYRFINIHPFADGNGRVKRMIMNVLLLKYAGHFAPFGGDDDEKKMYLELTVRASKRFHEEDMEIANDELTGHHEFKAFVVTKSKDARDSVCSAVRRILVSWAAKG